MSNLRLHSFPYDPFQHDAITAVGGQDSIIVAAPTGAGKTVIADYVIADALARQRPVIYTAPIKALSNQKYRDFTAQYGDAVGIVTGDVAINAQAPLRIMTTEIYRNTLLDQPEAVADAAWTIFDEVHYLDDEERGTVWEESLMLTPPQTRILCLSATVPNVDEMAAWLRQVLQRPTTVVTETSRPVPLHFRFQCQGMIFDNVKDLRETAYRHFRGGRYHRGLERHVIPNRLSQLIKHIRQNDELPCIYFAFGRRRTEELADEVLGYTFLTPEQQQNVERRYQLLCERYGVLEEPSAKRLRSVIRHGVAYHHAGMLPTLKEIVEQLFTAKLLPLIFTTETFALGINMPARTVVFDSLRKYYAGGFGPLRPRDFHQMAGRAGRRGMDTEGFVYVRLVPTQATLAEVQYSLFGQPDPVISQFNASYATTLNLYAHYGDKVLDMYPRTFHCFQASKRQRQRARQRFKDRLDALKAIGCIRRDALTSRGQFARWMFGYELYLSHLFEEGLLDRFSPHELCFALSCMVFEPRPGTHVPKIIPRQWAWVAREMHRAYVAIHHVEVRYDIEPAATPPRPHLGGAIEAWVKGDDFTATVELSGIDEGELVRYLRMIVQLLRQLQHAPYTSEKLRAIARTARALIDRGVVDAERQLRA